MLSLLEKDNMHLNNFSEIFNLAFSKEKIQRILITFQGLHSKYLMELKDLDLD
jgi:hypothetical protein